MTFDNGNPPHPIGAGKRRILQIRILSYTPEYAAKPASIGSTTPVIALAALSSHRKNTPPSSSSLSTKRPVGVPFRILLERAVGVPSSLNRSLRFWFDTRKPGAIALQRIPVPAKCVASHCVKFETAAFAPE